VSESRFESKARNLNFKLELILDAEWVIIGIGQTC